MKLKLVHVIYLDVVNQDIRMNLMTESIHIAADLMPGWLERKVCAINWDAYMCKLLLHMHL